VVKRYVCGFSLGFRPFAQSRSKKTRLAAPTSWDASSCASAQDNALSLAAKTFSTSSPVSILRDQVRVCYYSGLESSFT
jgi:hypothetical protein